MSIPSSLIVAATVWSSELPQSRHPSQRVRTRVVIAELDQLFAAEISAEEFLSLGDGYPAGENRAWQGLNR
jgi:hypothetical protein